MCGSDSDVSMGASAILLWNVGMGMPLRAGLTSVRIVDCRLSAGCVPIHQPAECWRGTERAAE